MIQFFKKKKTHAEIINNAYKELLNREPDEIGFNHYMTLFEKNKIDVNKNNISINSLNSLNNICNSNNDNLEIDLELNLESVDNLEDYLDAYDFMCGTIALAKDNEGVIEHLMRNNLKMNIKDYENNIL